MFIKSDFWLGIVVGLLMASAGVLGSVEMTLQSHAGLGQLLNRGIGRGVGRVQAQEITLSMLDGPQSNFLYVEIEFGETLDNMKKVPLMVDTGSRVTWFSKANCKNIESDPLYQTCFEKKKKDYTVRYLDMALRGEITRSNLRVGSSPLSKDHEVMIVQNSDFSQGILGLSRGSVLEGEQGGFISKLFQNGIISERKFTIASSPDKNSLRLVLGAFNIEQKGVHIAKTRITSTQAYFFNSQKVSFRGKKINKQPIQTLIDSGNTLISLPERLAEDLISVFSFEGYTCWLAPEVNLLFKVLICKASIQKFSSFPDFEITIEGNKFRIPSNQLLYEKITAESYFYSPETSEIPSSMCSYVVKIEFQANSNFMILGKTFLREVDVSISLDSDEAIFQQPITHINK